jgi:hypothetical protein
MKAIIKIAYRIVIDAHAETSFEKNVWNASYQEFLLKSQAYNAEGKFKTFTEMKASDGRANSLHYKSGFAIGHFINDLKNKIPYLQDTLEKNISFTTHRFEMIESDITNKSAHTVAIIFISDDLLLLRNIGDYMILSAAENISNQAAETFLVQIQPNLSIINYAGIEPLK